MKVDWGKRQVVYREGLVYHLDTTHQKILKTQNLSPQATISMLSLPFSMICFHVQVFQSNQHRKCCVPWNTNRVDGLQPKNKCQLKHAKLKKNNLDT